jgi:hypothetical protein
MKMQLIQFVNFSPQTSQHNVENYIDGEKEHTKPVISSLKLIASEKLAKGANFSGLLAELKP